MAAITDWPWCHWAQSRPEQPALYLDRQVLTWRQVQQKIEGLAAGFARQGVTPGCGVVLRAPHGERMLLAYLALVQCGVRLLPVNPQLPAELLAKMLPDLNIDFAFDDYDTAVLPSLRRLQFSPLPASRGAGWQPQRIATMTLTSGSSGLPKAAVHTSTAHLASAAGVLAVMDYQPGDRWLLSLPLFHVSGQGIVWRWLYAGAGLVVRNMHPLEEALQDCTHASLVPTQLWRLLQQSGQTLALKQVLLGGAMIPVELTGLAEAQGICCWCGYGMTEMASTVCAKRADESAGVGFPLPGREVRLVEEEVWVRSQSAALGYWRNGRIASLTDDQGWFHTRDRGVFDGGELRILGRLDNLFFSGGEGIQPEDIERVLLQHPLIHQVFVIPREDAEFGHRPVAVLDADEALDMNDLPQWLADKLPRFHCPDRFYSLPEALKKGGIKIPRQQVKEWFQ